MPGNTISGRVTLKQMPIYSDGVSHADSWGKAFTPEAKAGLCVHSTARGQCGSGTMSEGKEGKEEKQNG